MKILHQLILVACVFILGCNANRPNVAALTAPNRLVYVEARSRDGLGMPPYGDIVVFDIDTKTKCYITENNFIDEYPTWSADGLSIVFRTCRVGSDVELLIRGLGAPAQVSVFDYASMKVKRFGTALDKRYPKMMKDYYILESMNDNASILFGHWGNAIFESCPSQDTVRRVKLFEEFQGVFDMCLSPNGHIIGMKLIEHKGGSQIGIYDMNTDSLVIIPNTRTQTVLGRWSADGNRILLSDTTICEYDRAGNFIREIPVDLGNIQPGKCAYTIRGDVVLLARQISATNKYPPREVGIVRAGTRSIEWLTDDGYEKEYMRTYLPPILN